MNYAILAKNRGDAVDHVKWVMKHHDIDSHLDVHVLGVNTPHDMEKIRDMDRGDLSVYMCVDVDLNEGDYSVDMIQMLELLDADLRWFPPYECRID